MSPMPARAQFSELNPPLPRQNGSGARRFLLLAGTAALAMLTACSFPVRLASPAEIAAAQAKASPAPAAASGGGGGGGLAQFQAEIRALIDKVNPSVVRIDTASGVGSGVIYDTAGTVVTNAHVVAGATSVKVTTSDGVARNATVAGSDAAHDLAIVRIAGATGLTAASFGNSDAAHLGDVVLAIGSPLGLTDSVSEGIISGLNRSQSEGNGVNLTGMIQSTAAINPGNSGGALADITGSVIGIPTLGAGSSQAGSATGIGFSIPSNQVVATVKSLLGGGATGGGGPTGVAYLGVTTTTAAGGGARIQSVVPGGPAAKAGLVAGWTIVSIGGQPIADAPSVGQVLAGFSPGDKVQVAVQLPDGTTRSIVVTLGDRPAGTP